MQTEKQLAPLTFICISLPCTTAEPDVPTARQQGALLCRVRPGGAGNTCQQQSIAIFAKICPLNLSFSSWLTWDLSSL